MSGVWWFITSLWPFVWKYGIAGCVLTISTALYFLTAHKKLAYAIAAITAAGIVGYTIGVFDGDNRRLAEWERAAEIDQRKATEAIKDADLSVPDLTPEERESDSRIAPHSDPCIVYSPWDRDCRPQNKASK